MFSVLPLRKFFTKMGPRITTSLREKWSRNVMRSFLATSTCWLASWVKSRSKVMKSIWSKRSDDAGIISILETCSAKSSLMKVGKTFWRNSTKNVWVSIRKMCWRKRFEESGRVFCKTETPKRSHSWSKSRLWKTSKTSCWSSVTCGNKICQFKNFHHFWPPLRPKELNYPGSMWSASKNLDLKQSYTSQKWDLKFKDSALKTKR